MLPRGAGSAIFSSHPCGCRVASGARIEPSGAR